MNAIHICRRRVLVVDDHNRAARALALLLDQAGYSTCAVHAGEEALARCAAERFDILVLDHHMPGLTGLQVAASLHDSLQRPRHVVLYSAAHPDSTVDALARGWIDRYVRKPARLEDLASGWH